MSEVFWLREETKKNEFRRAITPDSCKKLIEAGHNVVVEDWKESIIPSEEYAKVGCKVTSAGSWINSPKETIVVGLKALPDDIESFQHRHVFFAHAYKEQDGWKELMSKFANGGGKIIDLEFMLDENKRRVCAFGYWAGYVGAALGALFSKAKDQNQAKTELAKLMRFSDKSELLEFVNRHSDDSQAESIVIGSQGRSGSGAIDCLKSLGWNVTGWDKIDTQSGGPFPEILNYDLFVNCVLAMSKMPPFINKELIDSDEYRLNTISDVSCDPDSECNMIPLYEKATTIQDPIFKVVGKSNSIDLVAIDNLPSILPKESSFDFSSQLESHLLKYTEISGPISVALEFYEQTRQKL